MRLGIVQKKILLLLLGGVALGLSANPRQSFKIIRGIKRGWKNIDWEDGKGRTRFQRSLRKLYDSKLICVKENVDGTVKIILTEKGKETAIEYDTKRLKPKKLKKWDGKWRIVVFDIPENRRAKRDAFRARIKKMGFLEMQKSVWISPVDYKKEIEYLADTFNIGRHVNFIVANSVENEKKLKKRFKIK